MLVTFLIGKYLDKVLCDVVPMYAGHIFLGRPWQYDRRVTHDGFKNIYSFVKEGKTIKLAPLTPSQVYEDQPKLKSELFKKERVRVKMSKKKRVKKKVERWLRVKKKEWSHERKKKESLQREKERQN